MLDRKEWAQKNIHKEDKILEIGPLTGGAFRKAEGWNTEIIDYMSQEDLKNKYKECADVQSIEKVDYIVRGTYADAIQKDNYYDLIFSSHNIEHMLDLIGALNDFSRLLKDNGSIRLIIPDKRFEIDYFKETTTLADVIDTHIYHKDEHVHSIGKWIYTMFEQVRIPTEGTYIPNSGMAYGNTLQLQYISNRNFQEIILGELENFNQDHYIGIHAWYFTPASFQLILYQLNILRLVDLYVESIVEVKNRIEFYVELRKGKLEFDEDYYKEMLISKKMEVLESHSQFILLNEALRRKKDIYIYGAGTRAMTSLSLLNNMKIDCKGLIVSDGHRKDRVINGKTVYELSEIKDKKNNIVVLIGVKDQFREDVINNLEALDIPYIE